ncbi:MAG: GNAT family N-acetyltransferase [Candidatus Abyssobacteria bacterium SURF_5]|uniref:GNAT family N-acetyltransferase n=1 Tax=Abyssobacteria bacterium (strain SURF_5) TaxID=2093360 RepID=A0A3A4N475_ABYX5|nr:MAG: GNAT family N-acetyltransferase [Candidatus Abyssubacteria bacterium SURF_5]
MSFASCTIRNYSPADLAQYIRLLSEAKSICHSDDILLLTSLIASSEPGLVSEEDLFLAEEEGRLMGACRVVPESAIDRAVLRLLAMPGLLERGLAAKLLNAALQRARNLRVARIHADLRANDSVARDLFSALGFTPVRKCSEMTVNTTSLSPPMPLMAPPFEKGDKGEFCLHPLEPGHERVLTHLQNRAFKGSWGFCPNTLPQIVQLLNIPGYRHEGVIVAYSGKTAVGYCWTAKTRRRDRDGGEEIGRIHMIGTLPEHRGQGLGKLVLWHGLKHLASSGVHTIELTVDNENRAARALYEKAGFKPKTALVWYEKQIM